MMFADSYLLCFKIHLWSALVTPEGKHQAAMCLFSDCFSQLSRMSHVYKSSCGVKLAKAATT